METEERNVFATSTYTPTYETERQRFRAMRSYRRIVLLCLLYGALFAYLLVRIGIQLVKIFAFHVPVYAAISMWVSAVLLILFVYLFVSVLTAPRRNAKRRIRQLKEAYPAVPTFAVTFYEEEIVLKSSERELGARFCYPVVKRCFETPDLCVLETKERQFFSLEKTRLQVVDAPGFRKLITEKCPKATCKFINDGGK